LDDCCSQRGKSVILQRRHCRTKDWPCLQAAIKQRYVCLFVLTFFDIARWCDVGVCGACVARKGSALSAGDADALHVSSWFYQCRGYIQCDEWTLDDCCSQRGKRLCLQRRHCRTKDWPYSQADYQAVRMLICFELFDIARWCDVGVVGACVGRKEARFEVLETNADALRGSRWYAAMPWTFSM